MRTEIKIFVCLAIALLLFSLAAVSHAQTNLVTGNPVTTNAPAAWTPPQSTVDDIEKVLQDFHINLSATNVTLILLALSKLAQVARKHWVQSDVSVIGKITKLVAVDSHPPAAVTNPPVNPPTK